MDALDYLEICRTLRVPEDIFDYFRYRESAIRASSDALANIPEPMLMGQFLSGALQVEPRDRSIEYLQQLIQDVDEFDLSGLLRNLHNNIESADKPHDYYQIMMEFAP